MEEVEIQQALLVVVTAIFNINASQMDAKRCYRKIILKVHPDKNDNAVYRTRYVALACSVMAHRYMAVIRGGAREHPRHAMDASHPL